MLVIRLCKSFAWFRKKWLKVFLLKNVWAPPAASPCKMKNPFYLLYSESLYKELIFLSFKTWHLVGEMKRDTKKTDYFSSFLLKAFFSLLPRKLNVCQWHWGAYSLLLKHKHIHASMCPEKRIMGMGSITQFFIFLRNGKKNCFSSWCRKSSSPESKLPQHCSFLFLCS